MASCTRALALVWALAGLACTGAQPAGDTPTVAAQELSIHTVFSAECTPYFDWQSLALVRSHREVGMPGPITRLLACDEAALKTYKYADIVPTHVHPNFARLHFADIGDDYVPYNKPGSIKHWLEHANVTEDIVFFIDADMIFLKPVTPSQVGVIPNRAVSAAYEYLVGLDAPDFVERFLPGGNGTTWPLLRKVGGWTMMYTADMRRVAPHWLAYTEAVRTAPDGRKYWFRLGDAYVTQSHPRPWISEMYGYSFGSAAAGVDHMVDHNLMLYPTYAPNPDFPPSILHYGLEFKVGPVYAFDKHWHVTGDRLGACPMQLFDSPPDVEEVLRAQFGVDEQGKLNAPASEVGRYTLAALTVKSLNAALAVFDAATNATRCPVCPPGCVDGDSRCQEWAAHGECVSNPVFMRETCKRGCAICECTPAGETKRSGGATGGGDAVAVELRGGVVGGQGVVGGGDVSAPPALVDTQGAVSAQQSPPPRRVDPSQHASSVVRRGAAEQGDGGSGSGATTASPPPLASPPPALKSASPPGKRLYGGGEEAHLARKPRKRVDGSGSIDGISSSSTEGLLSSSLAAMYSLPSWTPLVVPPAFVYWLWRRQRREGRLRRASLALHSPGRYED